jgi:hypothetical protein
MQEFTMSDRNPDDQLQLSATDTPSGGGISEDWLATLLGLAILALALFGFIPDAVLW